MKRILRYGSFSIMVVIMLVAVSYAQPVMSRGQQILKINYDECLRRAQSAFSTEGWVNIGTSGNAVAAFKGINASYIVCNPAPDTTMAVNIFVASSSTDSGVPGAERQRLQQRMDPSGTPPGPAAIELAANWSTNATPYRGKNMRITYTCPANGIPNANTAFGTDYYTDDSSVCTAAVHMGLISFASGGRVTIEIRNGAQSYTASSRYGVTSRSYGSWPGSFIFVR